MPTGRYHLHDALQSHRLPFWFGLAGSISDTVRCRRGQLYLGMPDTYPCRAARLSRWSGVQTKTASGWKLLVYGYEKTASAAALLVGAFLVLWNEIKLLLITKTFIELRFVLQLRCR